MIKIENVSKNYLVGDKEVKVLHKVNFEIKSQEFVSLIGPSGSGKSSLLYLIGGLEKPSAGQIKINDLDITKLKANDLADFRNKTLGFVFQDFFLLSDLTVEENIVLPAIIQNKILTPKITKRANQLMKDLAIFERRHHKPHQISGGQKQRTAIARALINSPALLLADEPTGNLDSHTGAEIIKLLKQLQKKHNMTLLLVTHDAHVAKQSDHILEIHDGKLIKHAHLETYTH